ncbi:hypothetical protein KW95_11105 [Clostridioides difficile]|nr:hypothetical protein KW95_11105 [Clostridioides difficile]
MKRKLLIFFLYYILGILISYFILISIFKKKIEIHTIVGMLTGACIFYFLAHLFTKKNKI